MQDIELRLKSPMESFPSINLQSVLAGWEYACLSQKTAKFYVQNQAFSSLRKMTLIYLVPDCKCVEPQCVMVKFYREYNTLLSYDCKTGFTTKIFDPSPVA